MRTAGDGVAISNLVRSADWRMDTPATPLPGRPQWRQTHWGRKEPHAARCVKGSGLGRWSDNPQVPGSSPGRGANHSIACVDSCVSRFGVCICCRETATRSIGSLTARALVLTWWTPQGCPSGHFWGTSVAPASGSVRCCPRPPCRALRRLVRDQRDDFPGDCRRETAATAAAIDEKVLQVVRAGRGAVPQRAELVHNAWEHLRQTQRPHIIRQIRHPGGSCFPQRLTQLRSTPARPVVSRSRGTFVHALRVGQRHFLIRNGFHRVSTFAVSRSYAICDE